MELRKDLIEWYETHPGKVADALADDDKDVERGTINMRDADTVLKILLAMAKDHDARLDALEK